MAESLDLLSSERRRIFSLLQSLVTTSHEAMILHGPAGIGKTFFLQKLKERLGEKLFLIESPEGLGNFPYGQERELVIALDRGDELAPGELNELYQYWRRKPVFSLIVALSPDGLFLKSWTDRRATEEMKLLDVPPLSREATERHLKHLFQETLPAEVVAELYRESRGVPGRMEQVLQESLMGKRSASRSRLAYPLYLAAGLFTITFAGLIWWLGQPPPEESIENPSWRSDLRQQDPSGISGLRGQTEQTVLIKPSNTALLKAARSKPAINPSLGGEARSAQRASISVVHTPPEKSIEASSTPKKYTLQLAAFRKRSGAETFIQRYGHLKGLEIRPHTVQGERWFVVIYGRYATLEEAKAARQKLLPKLNPWIRKLSELQP